MVNSKDLERRHDDNEGKSEAHEAGGQTAVHAGGDSWKSVVGFRGLVWGVSTFFLVAWCVITLGIGVNYASTFWDWLPIMVFGLGVPAAVLWQTNRVLAPVREIPVKPSAKDKEKELLTAFSERGELTAVSAAMRTSLTADEAAKMLDGLAGKGYVRMRVDDGCKPTPSPGRIGTRCRPGQPRSPRSPPPKAQGLTRRRVRTSARGSWKCWRSWRRVEPTPR